MKKNSRGILLIYILLFGVLLVVAGLYSFESTRVIPIDSVLPLVSSFPYLVVVSVLFIANAYFFLYLIKGKERPVIVKHNEIGSIEISRDTIIGLAKKVLKDITGIKGFKVRVTGSGDYILIDVKTYVVDDVSIPQLSMDLQDAVKVKIESSTDVKVDKVRIEIIGVWEPNRGRVE